MSHPGSQGQSRLPITPLWRPVRRPWSPGDQKWLGVGRRFMVGGDGLGVGWKGKGGTRMTPVIVVGVTEYTDDHAGKASLRRGMSKTS